MRIILCFTVLFTSLYALPFASPVEPSLLKRGVFITEPSAPLNLRISFLTDAVINEHLRVGVANRGTISETGMGTSMVLVALNYRDWVEVFGGLGSTQSVIYTSEKPFLVAPQGFISEMELTFSSGLSWTAGSRLSLFQIGPLGGGVQAQYFAAHSQLNDIFMGSFVYPEGESTKYHAWQVAGGFSYAIDIISSKLSVLPFVMGYWQQSHFALPNISTSPQVRLFDLKNNREWGYGAGFCILLGEKLSIGFQKRFLAEEAFSTYGNFRF